MRQLKIRKLVDYMEDTFVMPPVDDLNYNVVLREQKSANGLIRVSLERNIASQYLRSEYDRDVRKLWSALRATYNRDLVLNSDHLQDQILNLLLENEGTIVEYVGTLRQLYRELGKCGRTASPIDIFDMLTMGLPSDWEATK